jgi:hypothetical protein
LQHIVPVLKNTGFKEHNSTTEISPTTEPHSALTH